MAALGIERRIERLEKDLGMTGERFVVHIRRFGLGDGELCQFAIDGGYVDRLPNETESAFLERASAEALRRSDTAWGAVMTESKRLPTLSIPITKGEHHGRV